MVKEGKKEMVARGIRNNNPCNLKKSSNNWYGLVKKSDNTDPVFCMFKDAKYGIRAACKLFLNYDRLYGINTIRGIVSRFAPPSENNSERYSEFLCKRLNKNRDEPLNLYDSNTMFELLCGIITFENGIQPYPQETIRAGMNLAGVS